MQIFMEFPDFGFGPAASASVAIQALGSRYPVTLVSSGEGLSFAQKLNPGLPVIELPTFDDPDRAAVSLAAVVGDDHLVISNTNPFFSSAAVRAGLRTGAIDCLDWMWPTLPEELGQLEFRVAQCAFPGVRPRYQTDLRGPEFVTYVQPFVDSTVWAPLSEPPATEAGLAVVSLGGMALPFGPDVPPRYAQWLARTLLRDLVAREECFRIEVIGGSKDLRRLIESEVRSPKIHVPAPTAPTQYRERLQHAQWRFVVPGTTVLFELARAQIGACYLPGYNLTHFLGAQQIIDSGEPYLALRFANEEQVTRRAAVAGHLEAEHLILDYVRDQSAQPLDAAAQIVLDRYFADPGVPAGDLFPEQFPTLATVLTGCVDAVHEVLSPASA